MSLNKYGGYISKIRFNNSEEVSIKNDDIIIFVGPNNAGKSQALKDIFLLTAEKVPTMVVSDIELVKYNSDVEDFLKGFSQVTDRGDHRYYSVLGTGLNIYGFTKSNFMSAYSFENFRGVFVANLDTSARLSICNPADNIARSAEKRHPIHYASFDSRYRKWLSENFSQAFGVELIPNTQFGGKIPLCIGKQVKFNNDFEDEQSRLEAYAEVLGGYEQVHKQGDGVKSFTGILLYLMMDNYCIYLIDEPESFLHPPQARIMGQVMGRTLSKGQQAFISTHSEEIIKGLMDVCPQRIKIIRITRDGNINKFSILDNMDFNNLWSEPLLKYSNIMSSIFHKTVVLCESDSDCKMYSTIERYLKQSIGRYSETLFVHCSGKHRMGRIAKALRALNVEVKLIADIDVLNDENVFRSIIQALGIDWNLMAREYRVIVSNLHSPKEKINRNDVAFEINRVLSSSKESYLKTQEIKEIKEMVSLISKWDNLKTFGVSAIPRGDATVAFESMNKILVNAGIYIVPVGEMECFVKSIGGHGPEWVDRVLESYPDLADPVYNELRSFIESMNL